MPHDHDSPLCRFGQGTSRTTYPSNDYSTAYAALLAEGVDDEWADSLVCIYGAPAILDGLRHIAYNAEGRRVVRFEQTTWDGCTAFVPYILPVKRAEPPASPVPPVRSTATELAVVGAGVVGIMVACWWWPVLGLGAAAMAAVFAVACWAGGER